MEGCLTVVYGQGHWCRLRHVTNTYAYTIGIIIMITEEGSRAAIEQCNLSSLYIPFT